MSDTVGECLPPTRAERAELIARAKEAIKRVRVGDLDAIPVIAEAVGSYIQPADLGISVQELHVILENARRQLNRESRVSLAPSAVDCWRSPVPTDETLESTASHLAHTLAAVNLRNGFRMGAFTMDDVGMTIDEFQRLMYPNPYREMLAELCFKIGWRKLYLRFAF